MKINNNYTAAILLFISSTTIAILGALLTGAEFSPITRNIEHASSGSANFLNSITSFLPLGFAFTAGMVASVNPCGFSMLPPYLGIFLSDNSNLQADDNAYLQTFLKALKVGSTVSVAFVLTFTVFGLPIGLGARGIVSYFPWLGLIIGILLIATGAYMANGGTIYTNYAAVTARRIILPNDKQNYKSYFLFGIAYATASLSCTLPIFLAVVGGVFSSETIFTAVMQFILYGLGMGSIILVLTVSISFFKSASFSVLTKTSKYIHPVSSVLLLISGSFIVYYWLTVGEIILKFNFND
ncbi:MAG: cytochrome c biogenesis protein CcdA [Dehalococcoidia bacterium]|jgi:cytochrome c-type biogenesis protein|nr:cytochrome c biogenesis protein CcdA [Dehalococcoidia bacterium]HCH35740.1 cytochrome C biogenesis protein [Dehalococcoidia bacterium]|tara:strand:+ start:2547 stop:3437 length:891 start_codon:yes stop_codon:yes gene_type:complete